MVFESWYTMKLKTTYFDMKMKAAVIDDFVIFYYSNCFSCKHFIISKLMFLDVSSTDKLTWAMTILFKAPAWKWTRTGNCECQRVCMECLQKRKQMIQLVLTRGYFAQPPVRHCPRTLSDFVQSMELGKIERVEVQG